MPGENTLPPPPFIPFSSLAAAANTSVNLRLQLMKAPYISSFHRTPPASALTTDVSQVGIALFLSF